MEFIMSEIENSFERYPSPEYKIEKGSCTGLSCLEQEVLKFLSVSSAEARTLKPIIDLNEKDFRIRYMNSKRNSGILEKKDSSETRKRKLIEEFTKLNIDFDLTNRDKAVLGKKDLYKIAFEKKYKFNSASQSLIKNFETSLKKGYIEAIYRACVEYKIKWAFPIIVSQMLQESRGNPNIKSQAKAIGLFQFIKNTGQSYGLKNTRERKNPFLNIDAGVKYMKDLIDKTYEWDKRKTKSNYVPNGRRKIKNPKNISREDRLFFALGSFNGGPGRNRTEARYFNLQGSPRNYVNLYGTNRNRGIREVGQYAMFIYMKERVLNRHYNNNPSIVITNNAIKTQMSVVSDADKFFEKYKQQRTASYQDRLSFLMQAIEKYRQDTKHNDLYKKTAIEYIQSEIRKIKKQNYQNKQPIIISESNKKKKVSAQIVLDRGDQESIEITLPNGNEIQIPTVLHEVNSNEKNITEIAIRLNPTGKTYYTNLLIKLIKKLNPHLQGRNKDRIHKGMILRVPGEEYIVPRGINLKEMVTQLYPNIRKEDAIFYIKTLNGKTSGRFAPRGKKDEIISIGERIIIPAPILLKNKTGKIEKNNKPKSLRKKTNESLSKDRLGFKFFSKGNNSLWNAIENSNAINSKLINIKSILKTNLNVDRAVKRLQKYKRKFDKSDKILIGVDKQGYIYLRVLEKNKIKGPFYIKNSKKEKVKFKK